MKSRPVTRLVSGLLFVIEDKEKALNPLRFKAFLWQRVKDSNPHIQSQSLLCYLYTNPLSFARSLQRTDIIIQKSGKLSIGFSKLF